MILPTSEISRRAKRLLKSHGQGTTRSDERLHAEANGVVVVLDSDRSLHVHLIDGVSEGQTIYSEMSDGHVTMWSHLLVKEAIDRMAAHQVLDDLAAI